MNFTIYKTLYYGNKNAPAIADVPFTFKALKQNGNAITLGAVDKWRRRNAMNLKSLLLLAMIAKENNRRFDLYDYIIKNEKDDEK